MPLIDELGVENGLIRTARRTKQSALKTPADVGDGMRPNWPGMFTTAVALRRLFGHACRGRRREETTGPGGSPYGPHFPFLEVNRQGVFRPDLWAVTRRAVQW